MRFAALAVLLLATACQTAPPEMTEAEIAQIEAEVMEAMEEYFEGWRVLDIEMAMPFTETASWSWSSVPLDYASVRERTEASHAGLESYEGGWAETKIRVLTPDAAVFQGVYGGTLTFTSGVIEHWPDNVTQTNLVERTEGGWKITLGSQTLGTGVRIDQVFGTYDFSRLYDSDLPDDTYSSATLEWRPDGTWTVTLTLADGSDSEVNEGDSTVGPGPEGCLASTGWSSETPDEPFSSTYCDGLLTADDGTWIARQRN